MKGVVGFLDDPIRCGLIDGQLIHRSAIGGFERLLISDVIEDVETQTVITIHVHRLLGDVLEDLSTGEITQITRVVVTHQQLRRLLGDGMNAIDVHRC